MNKEARKGTFNPNTTFLGHVGFGPTVKSVKSIKSKLVHYQKHCIIFSLCMSILSGLVATEIGRNISYGLRLLELLSKLFFLTPEGGAQTTLHCALQEGLEPLSGRYFCSCSLREVSAMARDDGLAKKLWEVSERMCGLSSGREF